MDYLDLMFNERSYEDMVEEEFESLTKEFSLIKDTLEKLYEAKEYLEQLQNNEEEYRQCCKMINVLTEKENCLGIQIYG